MTTTMYLMWPNRDDSTTKLIKRVANSQEALQYTESLIRDSAFMPEEITILEVESHWFPELILKPLTITLEA